MTKRIAICLDGTWNKEGQTDRGIVTATNVLKLQRSLGNDSDDQISLYHQGVGTDPTDKVAGGAFGWGLFSQIKDAYRWLISKYQFGDQIYIFGFSRGAYSARSLAGMILRCGLLNPAIKSDDLQFPDSMVDLLKTMQTDPLYVDDTDRIFAMYKHGYEEQNRGQIATFKAKYCFDTDIRLVGVWDTVGSLGIPDGLFIPQLRKINDSINTDLYGFLDTDLSPRVQAAYHALAIDEHRKPFLPTLWTDPTDGTQRININETNVEQVWFAGAHCNIGGGYADSKLSDITLQWMTNRASQNGLLFELASLVDVESDSSGERRDSLNEFLSSDPGRLKYFINLIKKLYIYVDRPIDSGSWIHYSVDLRLAKQTVQEPAGSSAYIPSPGLKIQIRNGVRVVDTKTYHVIS